MPVMHFRVQWPDGTEANCYSPSTVVGEFLAAGESYALSEFVERSREALQIGSERVRVWRLYLRAARRGFETGFLSVFQVLGRRPD